MPTRDNRVNEAIAMKVPDRVPFQLFVGYFAGRYCDIPFSSAYYDSAKWRAANIRTITELEPDVYWIQTANLSGKALEILGPLQMRWPGFNVSPNSSHQMIELEPMKAEDYEAFLSDPSDYMMRTYLPRVFESAAPMAKLPPFRSLVGRMGDAFLFWRNSPGRIWRKCLKNSAKQRNYRQSGKAGISTSMRRWRGLVFPATPLPG